MTDDVKADELPNEGQTDDEILEEARKRFRIATDADADNHTNAKDDLRFLNGEQWPDQTKRQRQLEGRPALTINTLPTYLHQVTNDQRQNKPGIKIHPVDDYADPETAKVFQGLIRHIEYDSNADVCYDTAVNSAAAIGFGYFRWMTEYEDENSFNQVIRFKRIRNALSVRIDPLSIEPDGSDMKWCFIETWMSREEFKAQYPDAEAGNWPLAQGANYAGWVEENEVLVCEYYRIEQSDATLCLLSDGSTRWKDEKEPYDPSLTVIKERKGKRSKVMWYKLTGADILERTEILCKWIPVFPVYGDEIDIEGKVTRMGLVRNAKDPCMQYNFFMTSATEEVALRPKVPFVGAVGQFETAKADWLQANNRSFAFLEYDPVTVDGVVVGAPQRQQTADVPSGMLAMAMHASDNIKRTTGIFDSSLGAQGNATSGRQEIAQQRQGDVANFHFTDNLTRTIRHCGRTLVYSIPKYYDTERSVRILGEDESADYATINQPNIEGIRDESGEVRAVLNNLGAGTYDVTVSAGPGYATLRQEAVEGMASNMEKNPALWQVIGDLFVKNQDWPGAEEMAERIKKTIPPQILDEKGEDGEEVIQTPRGPLPLSQAPQAIAGMDQTIQQLEMQLQAQQAEAMSVQEEKANVMAQKVAIDAKQQVMNAEFAAQEQVMKAEFDRMTSDIARMKAELSAEVAKLDAQDDQVISELVSKFKDLESGIKDMIAGFQQADAIQDASRGEGDQQADAVQDSVMNGQLQAVVEKVLSEAQATTQGAVEAILQGRPPKQLTMPNTDMQQQMIAAMGQMLAEAQASSQAAVAAINEVRQPKQISITAPSGQVYRGVVQ